MYTHAYDVASSRAIENLSMMITCGIAITILVLAQISRNEVHSSYDEGESLDYMYLYYDEAILQRKKQLVQNPCTLEVSYTLGCMKVHPSCIVKYSD